MSLKTARARLNTATCVYHHWVALPMLRLIDEEPRYCDAAEASMNISRSAVIQSAAGFVDYNDFVWRHQCDIDEITQAAQDSAEAAADCGGAEIREISKTIYHLDQDTKGFLKELQGAWADYCESAGIDNGFGNRNCSYMTRELILIKSRGRYPRKIHLPVSEEIHAKAAAAAEIAGIPITEVARQCLEFGLAHLGSAANIFQGKGNVND